MFSHVPPSSSSLSSQKLILYTSISVIGTHAPSPHTLLPRNA